MSSIQLWSVLNRVYTYLKILETLALSGNLKISQKSGNTRGMSSDVREFSAKGCYFVFVFIVCLLDQGDEDSRGNISSKKSRYFDLDFF